MATAANAAGGPTRGLADLRAGEIPITVGAGKKNPVGRLQIVSPCGDGPVAALAEALASLPSVHEGWWSGHVFEGNRRQERGWRGAAIVMVDIDHRVAGEKKPTPPAEVAGRLERAARAGEITGSLFHATPHGARIVLVMSELVTNPATMKRVIAGAVARVQRDLERLELAGAADRAGYIVDAQATDLARFMFSPRSIVDGKAREAEVIVIGEGEVFSPARLEPTPAPAPAPTVARPASAGSDIDEATRQWNADHSRDYPRPGAGDCPVCDGKGGFGTLPERAGYWFCWHATHPDTVGRRTERGTFGTAIDLEAHARGISLVDVLRRDGYLVAPTICGARTRSGKTCASTDLLADGKCPFHTTTRAGSERRAEGERQATETKPEAAPPSGWRARIAPVAQSWAHDAPPPREHVFVDARRLDGAGYLARAIAAALFGEGGVGKSMALVQLAVAQALGERWVDTFEAERPGRGFVLFGEEDAAEVKRRTYTAVRGREVPEGAIVFLPMRGLDCALLARGKTGAPVETLFLDELRAWLVEHGPWDLIILDPLSRLGGPDVEIDAASATRFVVAIESIVVATGATVLVSHHTRKAARTSGGPLSAADGRGASALVDGFRAVLGLAYVEGSDAIELSMLKTNYTPKADPLLLRRVDGGRLVALTDAEAAEVRAAASGEADRKKRRDTREAETDARRAKRAAQTEAATRAAAERREGERQRRRRDGATAVIRVVRERPGINGRQLEAALAAALPAGCNRRSMLEYLELAGEAVEERPGARGAVTYHPRVDA